MALADKVVSRLQAKYGTGKAPPRAITGALQGTVFPSLERPKKTPAVPPMMPDFALPAPPPSTPAPQAPGPAPVPDPVTELGPFESYVENTRRGW